MITYLMFHMKIKRLRAHGVLGVLLYTCPHASFLASVAEPESWEGAMVHDMVWIPVAFAMVGWEEF